jgi:septum formation protein
VTPSFGTIKSSRQAKDKQNAFEILKSLSNTTHEVITSVCFKTNLKTDLHRNNKVTFNELSDETILYYIDNFNPYDKGRLTEFKEWIGFIAVQKIEGSYANVMGLPVDKVYDYLNKLA